MLIQYKKYLIWTLIFMFMGSCYGCATADARAAENAASNSVFVAMNSSTDGMNLPQGVDYRCQDNLPGDYTCAVSPDGTATVTCAGQEYKFFVENDNFKMRLPTGQVSNAKAGFQVKNPSCVFEMKPPKADQHLITIYQ